MRVPIFRTSMIAGLALFGGQALAAPFAQFRVDSVTATDLGTLGGANSSAADINNAGSIVGWAEDSSGLRRACLWRYGGANNLGIFQRNDPSEALGINAHDQVVGFWQSGGLNHAFRW
jgi:probable HAF family extracellular repeat protein